jgi:hypothetical protein
MAELPKDKSKVVRPFFLKGFSEKIMKWEIQKMPICSLQRSLQLRGGSLHFQENICARVLLLLERNDFREYAFSEINTEGGLGNAEPKFCNG